MVPSKEWVPGSSEKVPQKYLFWGSGLRERPPRLCMLWPASGWAGTKYAITVACLQLWTHSRLWVAEMGNGWCVDVSFPPSDKVCKMILGSCGQHVDSEGKELTQLLRAMVSGSGPRATLSITNSWELCHTPATSFIQEEKQVHLHGEEWLCLQRDTCSRKAWKVKERHFQRRQANGPAL